jgi:hypothetical protein
MTHANADKSSRSGVVVGLAFAASCCSCGDNVQGAIPDAPSSPGQGTLSLASRVIELATTRSDITVGAAMFTSRCGTGTGDEATGSCLLDGAQAEPWTYLELPSVRPGEFALAEHTLAWDGSTCACLSLKAFFNEVSFQDDSLYYVNLDDRYALVSYCTAEQCLASPENAARFSHNRALTIESFDAALSQRFVIELNDRPLP